MDAAEELHRFNRDVAESHERIAEKRAEIPSELGKDIKQVHSLWLKHEAFENQLSAMEAQLQVTIFFILVFRSFIILTRLGNFRLVFACRVRLGG